MVLTPQQRLLLERLATRPGYVPEDVLADFGLRREELREFVEPLIHQHLVTSRVSSLSGWFEITQQGRYVLGE